MGGTRPSWLATRGAIVRTTVVLALVLGWAANYSWIEKQVPALVRAELRVYQALSYLDWREPRAERVLLVEIDDATYWNPPLSGVSPTNRKYLADLAKIASDGEALAVAVDFRLNSTSDLPGDDGLRRADNSYLLQKIKEITEQGTPIILASWLVDNGQGEWKKLPLIFDETSLPARVSIGHINIPLDARDIPLRMMGWEWDGSVQKNFDSFALKIVNSYEDQKKIRPRTIENERIDRALAVGEFVYGGFLKKSAFNTISARDFRKHDNAREKCCKGQIVIIGGTWHEGANRVGELVDSFVSPVGNLPGLYMHANYVEALIDGRYRLPVSGITAFFLDLFLLLVIYVVSGIAFGIMRVAGLLAVFLILFLVAYISFTNFGLYLSFMTPLSACILHLLIEPYFHRSGGRD